MDEPVKLVFNGNVPRYVVLKDITGQFGGEKMACNCGGSKSSENSATRYVVRFANGQTQEFNSKVQADIAVTRNGGKIEVTKK